MRLPELERRVVNANMERLRFAESLKLAEVPNVISLMIKIRFGISGTGRLAKLKSLCN